MPQLTLTYLNVLMVFSDIFYSSHNALIVFREVLVNLHVQIMGQKHQKSCIKFLNLKQ